MSPADGPVMVTVNGVVSTELSNVATSSAPFVYGAPDGGTPFVQLAGSFHSPLPAKPVHVVETGVGPIVGMSSLH
jgi:hypothetical protein